MPLRISLALVAAPLALATPAAGQSFEGVIVWTMYDGGKPMDEMATSLRGGKSRIESTSPEGRYQLIDGPGKVVYTVIAARKVYLKFEAGGAASDDAKVELQPIDKQETIAGHGCTHYLYRFGDESYDVCAATGLGFSTMGASLGASGMSGGLPPELAERFKDGFQPLKMERVKGSKRELVMEVKSVERKSLPASLFELPAGFTQMKLPGRG